MPVFLRDVGAGKEGLALGRHEDGQGPAAAARHDLADAHVDPVHVGPLLAVDLDADEGLVHEPGHLGILEGLVGHDVAPVARGVPDGEEDRLVFRPGTLKGLVGPGVPVHGVVGVLEKIGALFADEPV